MVIALYDSECTKKSFNNSRCLRTSFSSESLGTRNRLWSAAGGRTTLRFFRSASDSDSFFRVVWESSVSSARTLFVPLPFFGSEGLESEESFVGPMGCMVGLVGLVTLAGILALMDEGSLVGFFGLVDFTAPNLVLGPAGAGEGAVPRDNELLLIFRFFVLISSASISFLSSLITP